MILAGAMALVGSLVLTSGSAAAAPTVTWVVSGLRNPRASPSTAPECTFDRNGNFWATEMFKGNAAGPPGGLVRINFSNPGNPQHIGSGQIPFPAGVVQDSDGAIYVTVNSAFSTTPNGAAVRVS